MEKKMSTVRLGIFIFIGAVLLISAIMLIGNKESMFTPTFDVYTHFENIEGLRSGASVRLSGIGVGSVSEIKIDPNTAGKVIIKMRLNTDIQKFIKTDSKASIETEGLVGNKVVVIRVGSANSPEVKNGGFIQSIEPLGFAAIIAETQGIMAYTKEMTKNLSEIVAKVNEGEGSIGKLLNKDDLYLNSNRLIITADNSLRSISSKLDTLTYIINTMGSSAQSILVTADSVVVRVDDLLARIQRGEGLIGALTDDKSKITGQVTEVFQNLIKITEETKAGAEKFTENMEALKRNWLFKSYFEERGYYDKTDYEKKLDMYIEQINLRLFRLDEKINELKELEKKIKKTE